MTRTWDLVWIDPFDVHLLPGRTVNVRSRLRVSDSKGVEHEVPERGLLQLEGASLDFEFECLFRGSIGFPLQGGFGVEFHMRSGQLTYARVAATVPVLTNFVVEAKAIEPTTGDEVRRRIRIHLHSGLKQLWLSPQRLGIRQNVASLIGVYARFDDDVVADFSDWYRDIVWAAYDPADPSALSTRVIANSGGIQTRPTSQVGDRALVLASISINGATYDADAEIEVIEPLVPTAPARMVPGSMGGKYDDPLVRNVLILPEGFAGDDDRALFDELSQRLVGQLVVDQSLEPFNLLADSINYWRMWVPSRERGITDRREFVLGGDGRAYPAARTDPRDAKSESWSVERINACCRLPVPADRGRSRDDLFDEWVRLFGADRAVLDDIPDGILDEWRRYAERFFPAERDSAFQMVYGTRPSFELHNDFRTLDLGDYRAQVKTRLLPGFVSRVRSLDGSEIGKLWGEGQKDSGLLLFLVRHHEGGSRVPGPVAFCTVAVGLPEWKGTAVAATAGGAPSLVPCTVDVGTSLLEVSAVAAHELAHSFGLGDEYGEPGAPALWEKAPTTFSVRWYPNLMLEEDYRKALGSTDPLTPPSRDIRWNWYRAAAAGVLRESAVLRDPETVLVKLYAGHGRPFGDADFVVLRTRPLAHLVESPLLRVQPRTSPDPDVLELRVFPPGTALDVSRFIAGTSPVRNWDSVLVKLVQNPKVDDPKFDAFLRMIAPVVRQHLDKGNILGRELGDSCAYDPYGSSIQRPVNLPDDLPRVRSKDRIVGLFDGGSRYHCGVLHPTGYSIMRHSHYREGDGILPFCAVGQYAIVDAVNPAKHEALDRRYARIYPHE